MPEPIDRIAIRVGRVGCDAGVSKRLFRGSNAVIDEGVVATRFCPTCSLGRIKASPRQRYVLNAVESKRVIYQCRSAIGDRVPGGALANAHGALRYRAR